VDLVGDEQPKDMAIALLDILCQGIPALKGRTQTGNVSIMGRERQRLFIALIQAQDGVGLPFLRTRRNVLPERFSYHLRTLKYQ
jgi:hypothetical protein